MKKTLPLVCLSAFAAIVPLLRADAATTTGVAAEPAATKPETPKYRDASLPVEARVEDLLSRMTLEEKLGQLSQTADNGNDNANNLMPASPGKPPAAVGSMIVFRPDPERLDRIQREAVTGSRLGIPILFGADIIHGARTIAPTPLATACGFDPGSAGLAAAMAAREARLGGIRWTFAPMIDVSRDARWGRGVESAGEDVHLNGVFAEAAVRGFQGADLKAPTSVLSCLKHYVGYGASESGRDYCFTEISPQSLEEVYLPPYEKAVRAGALTVMSAFNDLNGIPASGNRRTLTDILRGRLGFSGFVVSDWGAVAQLESQAFARDGVDAARLALHAGVDMDMVDGLYARHLPSLLSSGATPSAEIDEATRRILRVKFLSGLFENPYTAIVPESERFRKPADLALCRKLAAETFVLLQNKNGALPIDAAHVKNVAVVGPLAGERHALLGSWKAWGRDEDVVTIFDGLKAALPAACEVRYAKGCGIAGDDRKGFADAVAAAKASDVVVVCVGESAAMSGENASRATLDLPGVQEELVRAVLDTGKPVVLLVSSGRPLTIERIADRCAAIMAVWQGGSETGNAVADVLTGRVSPSGKLAVTWPRSVGQSPLYYAKRAGGRPGSGRYIDAPSDARYPFGYGLGYAGFRYSEVRLSSDRLSKDGTVEASVSVTNTGTMPAKETVLWFLTQKAGRVSRPVRLLKHFEKREIGPGETREFKFAVSPADDLAYPDDTGRPVLEPGVFEIGVMTGKRARFTLSE